MSARGSRRRGSRLADSVQPRSRGGRIVRWLLVLGLVGLVLGVGAVAGVFVYYGSDPDLPRINKIGDYKPKVVTRVVDEDGELLGEIFDERRTVVPRDRIPAV